MKLSKRVVDALVPRANEYTTWDSATIGLGCRMRPSGVATWIVSYRAGSGRSAVTDISPPAP